MRALSIKQPFADEILRRLKTIEYRRVSTRILHQRFYIYASMKPKEGREDDAEGLPRGMLVGTAVIARCDPPKRKGGKYQWHLTKVQRLKRLVRPKRKPQPIWFNPF